MKTFQTVLLIFFAVLIVVAVLIFSGIIPTGSEEERLAQSPVTMWGTMASTDFKIVTDEALAAGQDFNIAYVEKDPRTLEADLIDALASGNGPDLVLAPHTLILKQRDKFLELPYSAIPERLYRDSFVEATEVLLGPDHTIALPLYLDPIVMYWNRDMFSSAGLTAPPATWLEVQVLPSRLTELDEKENITRAAVAMGGVHNVAHFKEILASQILQTGNPIISRTRDYDPDGKLVTKRTVVLSGDDGAESALRFYVQFSDPGLKKYSWNSAMGNSFEEFVAGRLGVYFGLASEQGAIKERNPHLDFDVAEIPRIQVGGKRTTYTDIHVLAVLKNSQATQAAFAVAFQMSLGSSAGVYSGLLGLPPARRDLLTTPPTDPLLSAAYAAAVVALAWDDPDALLTRNIFAEMVESVTIGRTDVRSAVNVAERKLSDLVDRQ
jgi:ABC-type glycerol-3-phosphate transport system substrate-binding protein